MSDDLGERLTRAAGPAGSARDLEGLWERGRRRRWRRRVGAGLGAVVAVAALMAGGMAMVGGDADDEGVIAGPGSLRPPTEPIDVPVQMVVEAGPPLDGVPTLEAGDPVTISYLGYGDGWVRGVSVDWEAWDGSSWAHTHTLVLGGEPDGSDGQVVPVPGDLLVPAAGMLGPGPDPFPTPSDAGPGWYRVCVEVSGGGGAEASEAEDGPAPTSVMVTGPPGDPTGEGGQDPQAGEETPRRRVRPCAQLRILSAEEGSAARSDEGSATEDTPVTAHLSMTPAAPGAVHPGAFFMVTTEATVGGWHVATMASWERWDDERWHRTHVLDGVSAGAGAGHEPSVRADADASVPWASTSESPALPHETRFIAPPPHEAPPGRYRVCLRAVRSWGRPDEQHAEVCVSVSVEDGSSIDSDVTMPSLVPPSTRAASPG